MSEPAPGYISFTAIGGDETPLTVLAGDGSVTVTGGYGGWESTPRPGRVGLTTWVGYEPLKMAIPILFDNFAEGTSLEDPIKRLENLAGLGRPVSGRPGPPSIKVTSHGALVPHQEVEWVIESLEWGDALRNSAGNRIRQECSVTVMQYVSADALGEVSIRIRNTSLHITAPKGSTLRTLAHKYLGNNKLFPLIIKANKGRPTRDPRAKFKKAHKMVIPPKPTR